MKTRTRLWRTRLLISGCLCSLSLHLTCPPVFFAAESRAAERRLLYVAEPGIRNYLEYGGHGVLVYDIDQGHKLLRRIKASGLDEKNQPLNIKGVCASAVTKRLYVSTTRTLTCFDLLTDKIIWEKGYDRGCDRMSISPDGKFLYVPSLESDHWNVVQGSTGEVIREVGPFANFIRPFTVNGAQTLCFVNINELLGFEIGDLQTGKMLHRVEVQGFSKGPTKRHGCPSHGIGLTPDEKELWLTDASNRRLHIFDNTTMPPKQTASIELHDEPGWITFSLDGQYAYPSTGDVIDTATRKIVTVLKDEHGDGVQSEKLLEIDFRGNEPIRAGDQFGLGRKTGA